MEGEYRPESLSHDAAPTPEQIAIIALVEALYRRADARAFDIINNFLEQDHETE